MIFFATDDEIVSDLIAKAVKSGTLTFERNYTLYKQHTISSPDGYLPLKVRGTGVWRQITFGPEGGLTFVDLKDASIEDLGIRAYPNKGKTGFKFVSTGSSGRVRLTHVMVQGFDTGMLWEGNNGVDLSNWTVQDSHATGCNTGFKIVGSNALSPWSFRGCTVQQSKIGWDTTEGGSGVWWQQSGGSDVQKLWVVNGGYQGRIEGAVTERVGIVLTIGGDNAGGYGQPTPFRFHAEDLRDGASFVVNKAGKVCIDVDNVKNTPLSITTCNKSNLPLELSLPNVKGTVSNLEGKVFLDGTMVLPGK